MKIRILVIGFISLFSLQLLAAQDYFVLVIKNDEQSFKFSEDVVMNLIDDKGKNRLIKKNDAITVKGNYTLEIRKPLSEEVDRITINGGVLEIFVLPIDIREMETYEANDDSTEKYFDAQIKSNKSFLVSKEITKSKTIENNYNILLVFEDGLVFKYNDGNVRAWEDGEEVRVTENYNIATRKGILRINYNPITLETSWIWK